MIKKTLLLLTVFFTIFLVSCAKENDEKNEILPDDIINMENLDDYMFRDDVQYVDLRNFEDKFNSGYIDSFDMIPFFDYLDYRVIDRDGSFAFDDDHIVDDDEIYRLFDKDKAIFLYDGGCSRGGYTQALLYFLEYERVFLLGGFYEYDGEHKVLGTGDYSYGDSFYTEYTNTTTGYKYLMSGIKDIAGTIITIRIDILDDNGLSIRQNINDDFDYETELTIFENDIVNNMYTLTKLYSLVSETEDYHYGNLHKFDDEVLSDLVEMFSTLSID